MCCVGWDEDVVCILSFVCRFHQRETMMVVEE